MFENFFNSEGKREEEMQNKAMLTQKQIAMLDSSSRNDIIDEEIQKNRSDLLRWQQDLDEELMDLVYQLKGYVREGQNWVFPDNPEPMCNEKFINDVVIPQCKPYLSRNLINSNFSEERILMDLRNTADDIKDNMADGYDKYGIKFINYDLVLRLIKNVVKAGAFRALNGWTKKTDSTNFKKLESSFDHDNEKNKKQFLGF